MKKSWKEKVKKYCEKYNIPTLYLAEVLYEPKVVPMIRGKSFEFFVMMALQAILPKNKWKVDKPVMNAQIGFHDIDVRVLHRPTKKIIRIECKLAKKGGYRLFADGHSEIRVKCMRSRTLGPAKVKELSPKLGIAEKVLAVHNDQYLPANFDVVITSIGNAFYVTNKKTSLFEFNPTQEGKRFLQNLGVSKKESVKDFAFRTLYIAKSSDLQVGKNGIICTRVKCKNKKACGFIPNYPIISFDKKTNQSIGGWIPIKKSLDFFENLVSE